MIRTTLFPARFRPVGWVILVLGLAHVAFNAFTDFSEWSFLEFTVPRFPWSSDLNTFLAPEQDNTSFISSRKENFTNELIALLILIGSVLVAFTKEKIEDEYLVHLRLSALVWAVYVNAGITAVAVLFLYGFTFLHFMMFNLVALLLIFIARYHYLLRKTKVSPDEK